MKSEIIGIHTIYNEDLTVNCFEIVIHVTNRPKLKLGDCEVIQK